MTMEQIRAEITAHDLTIKSVCVRVCLQPESPFLPARSTVWRVQKIGRQWLYVHNNAGQIRRIGPDEVVEIMM